MNRGHASRGGRRSERGASVVELLVATAAGLIVAALCGHALFLSQASYRSAATRIDRDQHAQFALALIGAEVGAVVDAQTSTGCPSRGIRITPGRMEFSANLYDRHTVLRDAALSGSWEAVVAAGDAVEAGDTVMLTDPGEGHDPSDDVSHCARIASRSMDRLRLEAALPRAFPAGSPVALVNRVMYRLDGQARLMRTQDGGTQRIADHVVGFEAEQAGRLLTIRLSMQDLPTRLRRIMVEGS
ncbi:MAG: PilW family protein [Nitrospirota bacterium]